MHAFPGNGVIEERAELLTRPEQEWFWSQTCEPSLNSGCLEWTGPRNLEGDAIAIKDGLPELAQAMSFELTRKDRKDHLTDGVCINHLSVKPLCMNKTCVRPAHLFATSRSSGSPRARQSAAKSISEKLEPFIKKRAMQYIYKLPIALKFGELAEVEISIVRGGLAHGVSAEVLARHFGVSVAIIQNQANDEATI